MDSYEIYQFTYKDKKSGLKLVVYARTLNVAQEIVDIDNIDNCVYWISKRIGFKKKIYVSVSPYELELAQIDCVKKKLEYRKKSFNKVQHYE